MTKAQLKKKLDSLPPLKRKKYIQLLKKRQAEKRALPKKRKDTFSPPEPDSRLKEASDILDEIIEGNHVAAGTKAAVRKAARGVTLIELWKGLRAVAILIKETLRVSKEMHAAGVSRRADAPVEVPDGIEVQQIDPRKLYEFVKAIAGWWDCDDAVCWQCPYHRGKGIGAQNKVCAEKAIKDAYKHNTKVGLARGMPFSKQALVKMPRTRLVQVLGLLGVSAFKLKDSTKDGIVKWLTPARQKKFKVTPALKKAVAIPDTLMRDEKET
ncbi:MAG: hypothetical protein ACXAEN_23820 [Candidatus Thorarchaeota archaeon]|jgi:hypothetical protein